jgi:hypothetical protein
LITSRDEAVCGRSARPRASRQKRTPALVSCSTAGHDVMDPRSESPAEVPKPRLRRTSPWPRRIVAAGSAEDRRWTARSSRGVARHD